MQGWLIHDELTAPPPRQLLTEARGKALRDCRRGGVGHVYVVQPMAGVGYLAQSLDGVGRRDLQDQSQEGADIWWIECVEHLPPIFGIKHVQNTAFWLVQRYQGMWQ